MMLSFLGFLISLIGAFPTVIGMVGIYGLLSGELHTTKINWIVMSLILLVGLILMFVVGPYLGCPNLLWEHPCP